MRQCRMTGLKKILHHRYRMAHGAVATLGAAWVMRLTVDACFGRASVCYRPMRGRNCVGMGLGLCLSVSVCVCACELNMPVTGLWRLLGSLRNVFRAGQNQPGRHGITHPRAPGQQDN